MKKTKDPLSYTEYCFGPHDDGQVEKYLLLKDPTALDFAASRHQSREENQFDPGQIINQAIVNHDALRGELPKQRQELAARMSRLTLAATASALEISMPDGEDNDKLLQDPLKGPILRTMRKWQAITGDSPFPEIHERLEDAIAAAGLSIKSMPALPCRIHEALTFLSNDAKAPKKAIELAFLEWLVIGSSKDRDFYDRQEEQSIKQRLEELEKVRSLRGRPTHSKTRIENAIEGCRQVLKEFKKTHKLRENFVPGSVKNDEQLRKLAMRRRKPLWSKRQVVDEAELLKLLVAGFPAFWTTNSDAYKKLSSTSARKRKHESDLKRSAGRTGLHVREREKWLGRTRDLIEFLGDRGLPRTPEEIRGLLDSFADGRSGLKAPQTKRNNDLFFSTLIGHLSVGPRNGEARSILSQLRPDIPDSDDMADRRATRQRPAKRTTVRDPETTEPAPTKMQRNAFKAVTEDIIRDCLAEFRTSFQSAPKRDRSKAE